MVSKEILDSAPDNQLIRNTMRKADLLLSSYKNPVCSISGGSDSDIMLDLLERVRGNRKITYVFFNTGIEFRATLKHLDYLEEKYGIEIVRQRAKKTVPAGCKEYGLPFLSKEVAQKISYLQSHAFQWEDLPLSELLEKYDNCRNALEWWAAENEERKKYSVLGKAGLKEFMLNNPPDFKISAYCCNGAKKNTAKAFLKEHNCMLNIVGERKAEGGVRATAHNSCFEPTHKDFPRYMPLYFWSNEDKRQYKEHYNIRYSDCYEVYGMTRTGCCGCPFNSKFEEDLQAIKDYEPELYNAAINIFGKSYEYTKKYRAFRDEFKRKKKVNDGERKEL